VSGEPNMLAQDIVDLCRKHTFFSWSVQSATHPIPITRAEGCYLWDANGKKYLDFSSAMINVNIGYQNPKVVAAIKEQAERLCYVHPAMATEVRGKLGRLIAEITPGNLNKVFFVLGGAEANENAIKFARLYTGRHKIITRYRSYHGATYGAMSASGDPRRLPVEPGIPGVVRVFDPYCYRCTFGKDRETCNRECITHIEEVIQLEGPGNIAAIIMEGITGSNGIIIPPDDYWPRIRQICDKYGILLISDEIMSGFGRTGKWFAVDNWGVVPDIISMAKGLTAGYVPLGAVVVSEPIANYFEDHMLCQGLTYSGHALGCACGVAVINVYKEDKLLENCQRMGKILGEELKRIKEKHRSVGDVRHIGLFSLLEMARNRKTKEPIAPWNASGKEMETMNKIVAKCAEKGLSIFVRWDWVFVCPPLCINESQLREGLAILDDALEVTDAVAS